MKKKLLPILAVAMCFLTACSSGGENNKGDNTMDETKNPAVEETIAETEGNKAILDVEPEDFHNFVSFELPENFRQAAVDFMRKQASIEWTPGETFKTGKQNEHWGFEITYEKGKTYTGLLYTTKKTSIEEFQIILEQNGGTYTSDAFDYNYVLGVECNTSINHSLQQFTNTVTGKAETLMPSYADKFGGVIVGEYTVPDGARQTAKIISANTPEIMYEAYSKLDVGDIIITKNEDTRVNHLRMVVEKPTIVTSPTGNFIPSRSYIVTIEQTDTLDKTRKDGVNTTWWVDHQYTFTNLLEKNYVPVSVEAYRTGVGVVPYIALDNEITAELLEKVSLNGTVSSSYPIRFVHLNLYGEDGKLVNSVVFNGEYDSRKVNLRKYATELFDESIGSGKYTFELMAGISRGSAELAKVEFQYNK